MFKVGDKVKIVGLKIAKHNISFKIIKKGIDEKINEPMCTLIDTETGKHIIAVYDKYIIFNESCYRKEKLKQIYDRIKQNI